MMWAVTSFQPSAIHYINIPKFLIDSELTYTSDLAINLLIFKIPYNLNIFKKTT